MLPACKFSYSTLLLNRGFVTDIYVSGNLFLAFPCTNGLKFTYPQDSVTFTLLALDSSVTTGLNTSDINFSYVLRKKIKRIQILLALLFLCGIYCGMGNIRNVSHHRHSFSNSHWDVLCSDRNFPWF